LLLRLEEKYRKRGVCVDAVKERKEKKPQRRGWVGCHFPSERREL